MRWLNDKNKVSVHDLKYILEPKEKYSVGDEGDACYPGSPGIWRYRILCLGGKKKMEEWLDSNLNSLMVDHTDQFIIRESHTEASQAEATPKNRKREKVSICVSAKQFSDLNEEVRRLRKKLDWHINSETCGTSLKKESSSVHAAQKKPKMETISTLSVLNNTPDMCCQSEDSSLYNSYSRSQLADFISHIDSLYTAVKILLLQLFPESLHLIPFCFRKGCQHQNCGKATV
ncbi:unnamed protein product [Mytilus edulis]|uniref:Uncharacterized protein n=1 Tax=Mytilus edulis TaxID=6550 RepID=A0A8S3SQM1_MYTED|nr:unnamed protein product [Mytilus edulis]